MIIAKDKLEYIVSTMPESVDIEEIFDRILIAAKVEKAIAQSEQGLGRNLEDFKNEWLSEE